MSKNTQEYLTIKKATAKLLRAVQNNIIALGAELFSEDLISDDNYTSLKNETRDTVAKAAELVGYVANKVEQNPENYHTFVKILTEDRATYKDVLKILEPIYQDPDQVAVAEPTKDTTIKLICTDKQPGTFNSTLLATLHTLYLAAGVHRNRLESIQWVCLCGHPYDI